MMRVCITDRVVPEKRVDIRGRNNGFVFLDCESDGINALTTLPETRPVRCWCK